MDPLDSRDLDGVIDDVARRMTGADVPRDLRSAVASRLASPAPWTIGRRTGVAAAAVAALVVVAVVMRPTPEPQRSQTVADTGGARAATSPVVAVPDAPQSLTSSEMQAGAIRRASRPVARQTIDDAEVAGIVDISPVAIVPLEGDDEDDEDTVLTLSHVVEIAPIDVEPVRINGLELVE